MTYCSFLIIIQFLGFHKRKLYKSTFSICFIVMKNDNYIDLGERGRYNKKNKLNDLTGKEWIKFTKSWFIHNPPQDKKRSYYIQQVFLKH